jgi:peptidoglycan/xylan/chitin deacetylase (PgdA/CDA1 family)
VAVKAVVLMYHRIGEAPLLDREPQEEMYAVAPGAFETQLDLLTRSRCTVVSPKAIAAGLLEGVALPTRPTLLTFDDGNATDHSHVLPTLLRRGLMAIFFITPTRIGRRGFMSWDEVRELARAGMTVGAHGLEHSALSALSDDELRRQLLETRRIIEANLGRAPETMSLPGGAGGRREVEAAQAAGFRIVMGSVPRRASTAAPGVAVPRFAVRRGDSLERLRSLVEQSPAVLVQARVRHDALSFLKGVAGPVLYQRARTAWARADS